MVASSIRQVLCCSLAVLLLACTAEAARKQLPYPAASNAKDFLPLDSYPVGTDLTSNPQHFVTPSACFPSGAEVQTPNGARPIESLRLGDKVLTLQPSGKAAFEEVFMFSHQDTKQMSAFATLATSSGRTISATPGHYLWAQKPGQEARLTRAGDIQVPFMKDQRAFANIVWQGNSTLVGDDLFELEAGQSVARTVVEATRTTRTGLHNPHTASGSIVVDGIAASVVTDFMPASLALHTALTLPARALYHILPMPVAEALNAGILAGIANFDSLSLRTLVTSLKA